MKQSISKETAVGTKQEVSLFHDVLTHYELAQAQMKSNKVDEWKENKGGVDNIPLSTIVEFENKWDKI